MTATISKGDASDTQEFEVTVIQRMQGTTTSGALHSCALKENGTVFCWGRNYYGQIGDNQEIDTSSVYGTPSQVSDVDQSRFRYLQDIVQISAGVVHTCALKNDGTVYCWGFGEYGQLGDNDLSNHSSSTPTQVLGVNGVGYLTGVTQISAYGFNTCALRNDGKMACWGRGISGMLGDGNVTGHNSALPLLVLGVDGVGNLSDISQIAVGEQHTCALNTNGNVFCWGENGSAAVGNNNDYFTASGTPLQVVNEDNDGGYLSEVVSLSSGSHKSCAIKEDSTAVCWGNGTYGQLGNGDTTTHKTHVPTPVQGEGGSGYLSGITSISARGDNHSCAVLDDNTVWCWGRGNYGQLGDDDTSDHSVGYPTQVLSADGNDYLTNVTQVSAGQNGNCATINDNSVYCWGRGEYGALGDNDTTEHNEGLPVSVVEESPYGNFYLNSHILILSIGDEHGHVYTDYNGNGVVDGDDRLYSYTLGGDRYNKIPVANGDSIGFRITGDIGYNYCVRDNNGDGYYGETDYGCHYGGTTIEEPRYTPLTTDIFLTVVFNE
jgi:alpha-tubulin suppressor-like RCC1 family protein